MKSLFYIIFYSSFFIFLIKIVSTTGYIFTYDTNTYLKSSPNVQPVYSIFLQICKRLFNPLFFKERVIIIQSVVSYASILFFNEVIKKHFNFHIIIHIILFFLLTHPIYGHYKMCNKLVTEPIAYSLFLLFIASTIKWYFKKSELYIYLMIFLLIILILTRAQFLSTSIALTLFIWHAWGIKIIKKRALLFLVIVTIPITSSLIEKTIYGIWQGNYVSRELGNMSIATLPFFLSESDDINLMPDEESKHFFQCVYYSLQEKDLLANQLPKNISALDKHLSFHNSYPKISNQTISYEAKSMYNLNSENFIDILSQSSKVIEKTIKPLFLARPFKWGEMFYYNLAFPYYSIFVVIFLLLLSSYLFCFKKKSNLKNSSLIFFFSTLILGNLFLISISIHSIRRYFMYFDIVFALLIILILRNINLLEKIKKVFFK